MLLSLPAIARFRVLSLQPISEWPEISRLVLLSTLGVLATSEMRSVSTEYSRNGETILQREEGMMPLVDLIWDAIHTPSCLLCIVLCFFNGC